MKGFGKVLVTNIRFSLPEVIRLGCISYLLMKQLCTWLFVQT